MFQVKEAISMVAAARGMESSEPPVVEGWAPSPTRNLTRNLIANHQDPATRNVMGTFDSFFSGIHGVALPLTEIA